MAYATKYRFTFDSVHGVEHRILIQQDGYAGEIIDRRLGQAPVLKKRKNGPICGTSLEIYAECQVDGEFAELYTSNPREYLVLLYRGENVVWRGFVTPELYSEPSIAPPYDVEIIANDGLGELKLYEFEKVGLANINYHLRSLLNMTGQSLDIYFASKLREQDGSAMSFTMMRINMDYMVGKTCYDVLTRLLESLHMTITQLDMGWFLCRETDIEVSEFGSIDDVTRIAPNGIQYEVNIYPAIRSAGQMGVADMWPVGYMSTKIEPAKRSVKIQMPWQVRNILYNAGMTEDEYWTKNRATFNQYQKGGYWIGMSPSEFTRYGYIYQWHGVENMLSAMKAKARVFCYAEVNNPRVACYLQFNPDGGGATQYCYGGTWSTTPPDDSTIKFTVPEYNDFYLNASANAGKDYEWSFPPIPSGSTSGQLCVVFCGDLVVLYGAEFVVDPRNKGYEDVIKIGNGARGDADDMEVAGGRFASVNDCISLYAFNGILVNTNSEPCTLFSDRLFSGKTFLSIAALGYAESIALPRYRTTGRLDVPDTFTKLPLMIRTNQGGVDIDSLIETYEWDILNDELNVSALSLPVAVLDVESESVTEMH